MMTLKSNRRFPLGQVVITPGAISDIPADEVQECLLRHAEGDWGDVCQDDWAENDEALKYENRLLSVAWVQVGSWTTPYAVFAFASSGLRVS